MLPRARLLGVPLLAMFILACHDGTGSSDAPAALHDRLILQAPSPSSYLQVRTPEGEAAQQIRFGKNLIGALFPAVSPDGQRIAFSGVRPDFQIDLYVMNADGSQRLQLTNDPAQDIAPAWAPDGRGLLFTVFPDVPVTPGRLVYIRADGSGRRDVLTEASGGQWSPDGTRIAFRGESPRPRGILIADADGSNITELNQTCPTPCVDEFPRWSPDGRFMAFTRFGQGVGVMRADGTERRLLPIPDAAEPRWSPDGTRLAVTVTRNAQWLIYIVSVATGDTVALGPGYVADWSR